MWDNIINKSDSSIIILFVIIAIVVLALAIPIYKMKLKNSGLVMGIIQDNTKAFLGNTEALTNLKSVLTVQLDNCKDCKQEQLKRFDKIIDNQTIHTTLLTKIEAK